MDTLVNIGLVIGLAMGAGIGWGVSMWAWGEPNVELITTLALTLGVIGFVLEMVLSQFKK